MGIKQHSSFRHAFWVWCLIGWSAAAHGAHLVPTVEVRPSGTATVLALNATVEAQRQATVSAQLSGNVTALLVQAGDHVQAAQALARVDERDSAAQLSRAQAGVNQAQAEWQQARTQAERTHDLRSKGFVSQAAQDSADTQLKAAEAALQQAQGTHQQAALQRGHATVQAPFAGVVLATHVEAGDLASPGRAVATIYAPGALRVLVQVPASQADLARQASQTQVALPDGRWVTPLRRSELPQTDPVAQTLAWRLDLPLDVQLLPGQNVRVRFEAVPTSRPAVPSLPESAVLRRGELEAVYLVRDQRFVLHAVRLGRITADGRVPVLAGLKAGERVALDAIRAGLADAQPASSR